MFAIYIVRGDSMKPTLEAGDRLLVRRGLPRLVRRYDLVVLCDPRGGEKRYLKRVVGLPGEEVRLSDGLLSIDGCDLEEPYLGGLPAVLGLGTKVWRLGPNEYFVMGDNRTHSTDSREFGPVAAELIVGRAGLRFWLPKKWGPMLRS